MRWKCSARDALASGSTRKAGAGRLARARRRRSVAPSPILTRRDGDDPVDRHLARDQLWHHVALPLLEALGLRGGHPLGAGEHVTDSEALQSVDAVDVGIAP